MSSLGICHSCHLIWLLKKNSMKTRVETALERATAEGSELEETVAREMLEEENGITNPRLIPRSGKGDNEQSERILDNKLEQIEHSQRKAESGWENWRILGT